MNKQNENHNKQMDELYRKILDSRGELLKEYQTIATQSLKKLLAEDGETKTTKIAENEIIANNLNRERMTILFAILKDSKASRVAYFSYHNGGKDFIGVPYQRMSCINSVVRPGVVSVQHKFQNMFRAAFYSIYEGLQHTDHLEIIMENMKEEDPSLYEACILDDMKAIYIHSVKNSSGYDIGFVAVVYDVLPDIQKAIYFSDITAHRIEGISQVAEGNIHYTGGH